MITSWQIYWLTRLDYFQAFFSVMGWFTITGTVLWVCVYAIAEERFQRKAAIPFFIGLLSLFVSCFVPDSKEIAAIIILPKIVTAAAENKEIRELPENLVGLANEWLEELRPHHEAKKK